MNRAYRSFILLRRASRSNLLRRLEFRPLNCGLLSIFQVSTSAESHKLLAKNPGKNCSTNSSNGEKIRQDSKEILYRYKWIKQLRFISRVKILHVFIVSGLTGPMCYWFSKGIISAPVLITSVLAAAATTGGLFALSYFFRRVIGELSFNRAKDQLTISSLTFWGNRRNVVLPFSNLIPLSDRDFDPKNLFHRIEFYENDFVYLLNLRHGKVYDNERLLKLLGLLQEDVKREDISYKPLSGDILEVKSTETVGRNTHRMDIQSADVKQNRTRV